jgi:hypothetical protein
MSGKRAYLTQSELDAIRLYLVTHDYDEWVARAFLAEAEAAPEDPAT